MPIAEEWKKFGLYFAGHIFYGIQENRILRHYNTLVQALLILLGPEVVRRDVQKASDILIDFIRNYQASDIKTYNQHVVF